MRAGLRLLCLVLGLFSLAVGTARAAGFVEGVEDLPLMDGLEAEPGSAIVFDKPDGRIVEAFATGRVGRAEAVSFYETTLPQLGWSEADPKTKAAQKGGLAFARDGETLRLEFRETKGLLRVRFAIAPD